MEVRKIEKLELLNRYIMENIGGILETHINDEKTITGKINNAFSANMFKS